jgi:hypothetical protein
MALDGEGIELPERLLVQLPRLVEIVPIGDLIDNLDMHATPRHPS